MFDDIQGKLRAHAEAGFTTFDTADIYGPSEGTSQAPSAARGHCSKEGHTMSAAAAIAALRTAILGEFAEAWLDAGNAPVTLLTKYVPNIFQAPPTPASVEAAVQRSLTSLRVCAAAVQPSSCTAPLQAAP